MAGSNNLFVEKQKTILDQHLHLSEYAAKYYDDYYLNNPVIKEVIKFEETLIRNLENGSNSKNVAVELGCGTGKKTLLIGEIYKKVYAYDISNNMLEKAKSNIKLQNSKNIYFEQLDIDKYYTQIKHKFSFLYAGFGFASFLTQLSLTLEHFFHYMEQGGVAFFSFYNKFFNAEDEEGFSILNSVDNENYITVKVKEKFFSINAISYTIQELNKLFSNYSCINLLSLYNYPAQLPTKSITEQQSKKISVGKYIGALIQKE